MNVVSLFSGLGGLDKGFADTGYNIVWANDFDKYAVQTYKANFGDHIVLGARWWLFPFHKALHMLSYYSFHH